MAFRMAYALNRVPKANWLAVIVVLLALTAGIVLSSENHDRTATTQTFGSERLIAWERLPEWSAEMCPVVPPAVPVALSAALQPLQSGGAFAARPARQAVPGQIDRDPLRVIRDPYPGFSAVAVDMERGEVVVTDENLFQILVYDRLANTPPTAALTEPLRIIGGDQTGIEFACGVHVDQATGDIYIVHGDTEELKVFTRNQKGNVAPARQLETLKSRGIAVDSKNQEIIMSNQHDSALVVFRQQAAGHEPPIRLLQGDRTRLANPHGVALDSANDLVFVTNHGQVSSRPVEGNDPATRSRPNQPLDRDEALPGTGRFLPPSVNVYRRTASGNTPPLRVIEGPRTQLNWPTGIVIDERRGELFVANDTGDSVLVFRADASGDVAPKRILKGPNTALDSPGGLFLDTKNNELWVSNYGNNSLTVYQPAADGNTKPLRMIRSAPAGNKALMIGNPGFVAYDTKREQILVPN
jgi:DNA-binding beta-propeller fold protein YncE